VTTVVNMHRGERYDVYIGRPSKWGNPYSHLPSTLARFRVGTRQEAIDRYSAMILDRPDLLDALHELKGRVLGCWCKPLSCHGDFLAELAELLA
jgi:hypothetical protein